MKLLCIKCLKEVADVKDKGIDGITTWFPVCSECLFNVKGWTRKEIKEAERKHRRTPLEAKQTLIMSKENFEAFMRKQNKNLQKKGVRVMPPVCPQCGAPSKNSVTYVDCSKKCTWF